ncbi:MAG: chromate efflux transporter [Hyphomicrobiaceae bacterium]
MSKSSSIAAAELSAPPTFVEAVRVWARIGALSFGGPAGQIALMHRILVDERRWLSERQYLSALNFCMLLPGPEAMQLATYAGWRLHGTLGGLAAGLLFVLPGAALIFALAVLYLMYGAQPLVAAAFVGIKAAVVVIVVEALLRVARRALKQRIEWGIAAAAFVAIYALHVPFPVIILAAALAGFLMRDTAAPAVAGAGASPVPGATVRAAAATAAVWLAIWIAPLAVMAAALGTDHVLSQMAWFFSKLAVVTFGGAYAVLAYMAQEVVQGYRWLQPGEMLDALGLAETTPGPLILVTEFVGVIAAARSEGGVSYGLGLAGALVTLWATFAPCFLWIFTGAPFIERLTSMPRLQAALGGVTAAVVGVILNLSLWFALHVVFKRVETVSAGPLQIALPDLASLDVVAAALTAVAAFLLLVRHRSILLTLAVCAALAIAVAQAAA